MISGGGYLGLQLDTPERINEAVASARSAVTHVEVDPISISTPVNVVAPAEVAIRMERVAITSKAAPKAEPVPEPEPVPEIKVVAADPVELSGATLTPDAQKLLQGLDFRHPVDSVKITSRYGGRSNPTGSGHQFHVGQDYGIRCGKPVRAMASGTIIQAEYAGHSGNRVTVDHGQNVTTAYSHNSAFAGKVGDEVERGQIIARTGTTGNSTGCHVHLELIVDGQWVNAALFLPGAKTSLEAKIIPARDSSVALPAKQNEEQSEDVEANASE